MFRWISSVPPRIDIDGPVRKSMWPSPSSIPAGPRASFMSVVLSLKTFTSRNFPPDPPDPTSVPCSIAWDTRVAVQAAARCSAYSDIARSTQTGSSRRPSSPNRRSQPNPSDGSRPPPKPPMLARSCPSTAMAMAQPWPSSPSRSESGTRTSVVNTSQKCLSPFIWWRGRISTPAAAMSTANMVSPLCLT